MSEIDPIEAEEDEEEIAMTAAEVLEKLEEAWLNEKFAPELLEAKTDLVECMFGQITAMEENIKLAKKGDFKISVHRMELDRIRYILSSYLRIRLNKIENYTSHILEREAERSDEENPLLSPEEFIFAKEFNDSIESHFNNLALRHMPSNLQTLTKAQKVMRPNLNSYVFIRVNEDAEGVLVEEETMDTGEEIVDLQKNDQHIMRYKPLSQLIASGTVSLI